MKIKNISFILPLVIIVVILGFFNITYLNRIKSNIGESKLPTRTSSSLPKKAGKTDYDFEPLARDPFNVMADTGQKGPQMPQLSLRGIVLSGNGALALMALPDGNVYPMKKGEKYLGVKVIKVTPKQVTVEFRGAKETFNVWE